MEPSGFIELNMEQEKRGGGEEFVNDLNISDNSLDETNYRKQSRFSHQLDLEEVSLSSGGSPGGSPRGSSGGYSSSEGSSVNARTKSKKEGNGLRAKRGGKALKIMVSSPKEEEQRRKALYLESMAGNAPLYPLDLQDLSGDSGPDEEESDRSSLFSPEVAANGFGSPIDLPSRDIFDDLLNRRQAEAEKRMQVMTAAGSLRDPGENGSNSLQEIPLTSKFDPMTVSEADKYDDDEISPVEESVSIDLPSRGNFADLLNRRQAEAEKRMQVMTAAGRLRDPGENGSDALHEIPLTSKFDPMTVSEADKYHDDEISPVEESVSPAGKALQPHILKTVILILVWYIFSTLLTLYNKLLLGLDRGHFPAPLLMNTIHFSMQAVISTVVIRIIKPSLLPTVSMSWKDYFLRVVPTALATALDIDLTNVSLVFISVTFATMCKSGAPVFLLLFAFAFKLEVPSYKLLGIMLIISSGVMLTVAKEESFNIAGFILVMAAAIMSGFRWTVTQLLLQKEEYGLNNPFAVMSYLTPVMAAVSLILSLITEPWSKFAESHYFDTPEHVLSSSALMLFGGALAFCMVSAEYLLISATSAVALTVAGVVKEVVTILVSVIFLKDNFTILKGVGLAVIILGVSLFNWFRYQKLVEGESGIHGPNSRDGNHKYVALRESNAVFELGDDLDEDIL